MPYDFTNIYRVGKEYRGADALSRRPIQVYFFTLVLPINLDPRELQQTLGPYPYTKQIINDLNKNPNSHPNFSPAGQKLYFNDKLVILQHEELRDKILFEAHNTLASSHGGFLKTLKHVSSNFFWP